MRKTQAREHAIRCLRRANEAAIEAGKAGNTPFGAVLADDETGEILMTQGGSGGQGP